MRPPGITALSWALACASALLGSTVAAAAQGPAASRVSDEVEAAFLSAVREGDPVALQRLFGARIADIQTGQPRLTSSGALLGALRDCSYLRTTHFPNDPDLWVEWHCPSLVYEVRTGEQPGYLTRLWHHPAGLTVGYGKYGVVVRPTFPPPAPAPTRP